jgi:hypothetical protein
MGVSDRDYMKRTTGQRDKVERWIDRHNHKLELVRTFGSLIAAVTGVLVFLKVFEFI